MMCHLSRFALACATLLTAAVTATSVHAQTRTPAAEPRTYWLVVTGLSGEPAYAATYAAWAGRLRTAARERFGATDTWWLAEKEGDGVTATSTRANFETRVRAIAVEAEPDDALFIILFGHGSPGDGGGRIALPGPDLAAADLALWLSAVRARTTVVNTTSASGGWVAPLAAKGRIVVTATRSATEQNDTEFPAFFVDALTLDAADTDKDSRVSVLEAYEYARREVQRSYAADKRMLTEHAQIDGNGDGTAVAIATADSPDGGTASLTHFGTLAARAAPAPAAQAPALRALYTEKVRLERQLADLRARKADVPVAEYQKQLEALLTDIAVNGQAIRRMEGGR